jgi:flagellar hook-associated protein 3 FlgL
MRVTFTQTYDKLTLNINSKQEAVDRYSNMVASGKRFQKAADDPWAWARSANLQQGLREIEAFQKNVTFGNDWNQASGTALYHVADLVSQAKQAASEYLRSPDKQQSAVLTLNELTKDAVWSANSKSGDRYLFSGRQFSTAPFEMTLDANGDVTAISAYQGDTQNLEVRVGKGSIETVNINGQAAFATAGTDVLQQLLALKNAVQSGDATAINQQMTALDSSFKNVSQFAGQTGIRQDSLDRRKDLLYSLKTDSQSELSDLTEVDTTEAIVKLQQAQTVYEAALRAAASLSKLNLTEFL